MSRGEGLDKIFPPNPFKEESCTDKGNNDGEGLGDEDYNYNEDCSETSAPLVFNPANYIANDIIHMEHVEGTAAQNANGVKSRNGDIPSSIST